MAASLRALRRRIRSTQSTKKIFSAQELIAGARIVRAQARVEASKPYAREITRVLSALASSASLDHPLLTERQDARRAAVLVITSDRGFAGSYNVNVLRRTEESADNARELLATVARLRAAASREEGRGGRAQDGLRRVGPARKGGAGEVSDFEHRLSPRPTAARCTPRTPRSRRAGRPRPSRCAPGARPPRG